MRRTALLLVIASFLAHSGYGRAEAPTHPATRQRIAVESSTRFYQVGYCESKNNIPCVSSTIKKGQELTLLGNPSCAIRVGDSIRTESEIGTVSSNVLEIGDCAKPSKQGGLAVLEKVNEYKPYGKRKIDGAAAAKIVRLVKSQSALEKFQPIDETLEAHVVALDGSPKAKIFVVSFEQKEVDWSSPDPTGIKQHIQEIYLLPFPAFVVKDNDVITVASEQTTITGLHSAFRFNGKDIFGFGSCVPGTDGCGDLYVEIP